MEAVAEVEAVVSEGVRLLEARSDAFAVETRPGEIWITGELAILCHFCILPLHHCTPISGVSKSTNNIPKILVSIPLFLFT